MLAFQVDTTGLTRMEQSLASLAEKQLKFAMAQALNDCTRAASVAVNKAMPTVFDRPIPFTDRAAIAPRDLAANPNRLVAVVTLRPTQAQYLLHEEIGGTRLPSENTRKPNAAMVMPGVNLTLDAFGNIPNATIRGLRQQAAKDQRAAAKRSKKSRKLAKLRQASASKPADARAGSVFFLPATAPGNKAHVSGYFRRLGPGQITRITAFVHAEHYKSRLGYHERVQNVFKQTWTPALAARLQAALATAKP